MNLDADDPAYRDLESPDLVNEDGVWAGLFGWCVVCRRSADLYCKDVRDPICCKECK